MLLNEIVLEELVADIKKRKIKVESLTFVYHPQEKTILINADGPPDVVLDDEYYENIFENILCCETMWLDPLTKIINTRFEAKVNVDTEGNFMHDSLDVIANYNIRSRISNLLGYLYSNLKNIVKCYASINRVKVMGYKNELSNIYFYLNINGKKVNTLLKESNINKRYLEQWLVVIDKCDREIGKQAKYSNTFRVINGKINYETRTEVVSQLFKIKKEREPVIHE